MILLENHAGLAFQLAGFYRGSRLRRFLVFFWRKAEFHISYVESAPIRTIKKVQHAQQRTLFMLRPGNTVV